MRSAPGAEHRRHEDRRYDMRGGPADLSFEIFFPKDRFRRAGL
jgi:hypothetical protein